MTIAVYRGRKTLTQQQWGGIGEYFSQTMEKHGKERNKEKTMTGSWQKMFEECYRFRRLLLKSIFCGFKKQSFLP